MKIKKFNDFILEVSGTELPTGPGGSFGPGFGETRLQNKTVSFHDTNVFLSDIDNKFYTIDEWNNLYNQYLKSGGDPLGDGEFNRENLNTVVSFLNQ